MSSTWIQPPYPLVKKQPLDLVSRETGHVAKMDNFLFYFFEFTIVVTYLLVSEYETFTIFCEVSLLHSQMFAFFLHRNFIHRNLFSLFLSHPDKD